MYSRKIKLIAFAIGVCALSTSLATAGPITDFNCWTEVVDPAHPNFSSSIDSPSQVTLSANGGVPLATDIGFKSINGLTAALSNSGNVFDPAFDFSLAIDYDFNPQFLLGVGGMTLGFGIGEDADGMNSAGIVLTTTSPGLPVASSGGAARVDDVDQLPLLVTLFSEYEGSFFVSYEAASGNVTVGIGDTGAAAPEFTGTFNGIQNSWDNVKLFPSFFIRSDNALNMAWASGSADAIFSNFRILEGVAMELIPEPTTLGLAVLGCLGIFARRRKRL